MPALAVALTVATALLFGVGVFLYNDGRDHRRAGAIGAVLGFVGGVVGSVVATDQANEDSYNCTVHGEDCVDTPSEFWGGLFDATLKGPLIDGAAAMAAGGAGLGLAKLTRRRPQDGRAAGLDVPEGEPDDLLLLLPRRRKARPAETVASGSGPPRGESIGAQAPDAAPPGTASSSSQGVCPACRQPVRLTPERHVVATHRAGPDRCPGTGRAPVRRSCSQD